MVILGLLAIFQVAFLPGLIVSWWLPLKTALQRLLVAFSLSLLINHFLVLALVLLRLYTTSALWGVFALEIALLAFSLWWHRRQIKLSHRWQLRLGLSTNQVVQSVFVILALIALWFIGQRVWLVSFGVFNLWDDIVSFNRWALDWYAGIFPSKAYYYPQLIPTSWSMIYKFMGTSELQSFAKGLMGLFPVMTWLVFADLARRFHRPAWWAGSVATVILLFGFTGQFIGAGYVDIPMAFFALMAYYLIVPDLQFGTKSWVSWVLAAVLAGAAALTKQAGLYMLIPILVLGGMAWGHQLKNWLKLLGRLAILLAIFLALVAPWYIYKTSDVRLGREDSEFGGISAALQRAVGNRNSMGRIWFGLNRTATQLTWQNLKLVYPAVTLSDAQAGVSGVSIVIICLIWVGLLILGWKNRVARYALITIAFPFFIVWALFYSYDFRNLTLILPFWGLATGFGLVSLLNPIIKASGGTPSTDQEYPKQEPAITSRQQGISSWWIWGSAIIIGLIILVYGQIRYPLPKLIERQNALMRDIGTPALNQKLYAYYEAQGLSGKIRSMYQPLNYLPQLKDYSIATGDNLSLSLMQNIEGDPTIHYILWWANTTEKEAADYIFAQIDAGRYQLIFQQESGYYFLKIK